MFSLFGIAMSPVIVKNTNKTKTSATTINANITIKVIKSSSSIVNVKYILHYLLFTWCERRDLNPQIYAPKAYAYANSATLA